MIRVSLTVLIFIYLALCLTVVFALWIWLEWARQRCAAPPAVCPLRLRI